VTDTHAYGKVKRAQIEAVVVRADGTRHQLGVIADSKWGRVDPRRLASRLRIRRANRDR